MCPAPCEGACTLGINEPAVAIKTIEVSIVENAFEKNWIQATAPVKRTGKYVAIVGSGPAGLAAADQLNKVGHQVVVFERQDRVGGLLQYGIPTMKLSKQIIQRRIDIMTAEGVEFRTNVNVGIDVSASRLLSEFDAICLAIGATWPRDLPIAGRQLAGIYFAVDYLKRSQQALWREASKPNFEIDAKDKNVVVIGGGDTGCDCIGTSLRQGAKSVVAFEILPKPPASRGEDNPWPQWPRIYRVDYGHEEANLKWDKDPRIYEISSKEFIDDGHGNVKGIKTVRVEWTKDENGRWKMNEIPDSEEIFEVFI